MACEYLGNGVALKPYKKKSKPQQMLKRKPEIPEHLRYRYVKKKGEPKNFSGTSPTT